MSDDYLTERFSGSMCTLTIVFIVLKLTHVISWSWWWVFSPIWISLLLIITAGLIGILWACLIDQ